MEKATGIVRKLDELGRIVIPKELRDQFDIKEKDPVEIFVDDNSIVLKKYEESCLFCSSTEELTRFKDKLICHKCMEGITKKSTDRFDSNRD